MSKQQRKLNIKKRGEVLQRLQSLGIDFPTLRDLITDAPLDQKDSEQRSKTYFSEISRMSELVSGFRNRI